MDRNSDIEDALKGSETRTLSSETIQRVLLALASLAAAAVHFAVMGEHFAEWIWFGVFFAVVGWLQAIWAVAICVSSSRRLLVTGAIGNAVVVLVWLVSRTTGLPIGPEPGAPESIAFLDALSTIVEATIIVGIWVLLRGPRHAQVDRRVGLLAVAFVAIVLGLATTVGVAAAEDGAGEGHEPTELEETGSSAADPQAALASVELEGGETLQVLADRSGQLVQLHLTFFSSEGDALNVSGLQMLGTSPTGEEVKIPMDLFDEGHFAASIDLEPGAWTFDATFEDRDGGSERSFELEVP